jgi:hypothetical protein
MSDTSLFECTGCARHVRAGERACPFCGANIDFFMSTPEYRLKTRLNRGQLLALGAALAAIGIACSSDVQTVAAYGAPGEPLGGQAGDAGTGGTAAIGGLGGGGTAGSGGSAGSGGTGGRAGTAGLGAAGDDGGGSGEGGAKR